MIEKVKNFYKTKRILFFVVIFVWLILTISPEEENARAIANMEEDEEKIIKGEMLSTKGNLDIEQMEYSKNYIKNKKNK
ncbi:MAG: hypothetical protein KHX06_05875 [Brachyspira sp.]|nr:hypothetical protein [Brachyspira sp.]